MQAPAGVAMAFGPEACPPVSAACAAALLLAAARASRFSSSASRMPASSATPSWSSLMRSRYASNLTSCMRSPAGRECVREQVCVRTSCAGTQRRMLETQASSHLVQLKLRLALLVLG